jgi:hypothetical protein
MGYLCGFLLLLLGPDDVAKVLHRIGTDDKYTPGYWKGQPEAFVRDAMVYMRLVQERLPVSTSCASLFRYRQLLHSFNRNPPGDASNPLPSA